MEAIHIKKYTCKYPKCKNAYFTNNPLNKHFFRFSRLHLPLWKDALKLSPSEDVHNWRLCEDHFEIKDFRNQLKNLLNFNAVPMSVNYDDAIEHQQVSAQERGKIPETSRKVSSHSHDLNDSSRCCSAPTSTCISCTCCNNASSSTVVCEDFETGINYALLEHLQVHVSKLKKANRRCTLLFGIMMLQKEFHYEHNKQFISGFEDLGSLGRTNKSACYALVFMVRGLRKQFKQVVAHYFTANAIDANNLSSLIKEIIGELQRIGLIVVGTVCDHTSTNEEALSQLFVEQNSESRPFCFVVNGQPIVTIYNMCHLFKSTRNAMLKCKIQFEPNKYAKFEHIQFAFNHDQRRKINSMPRLEQNYFNISYSNYDLKVKEAARTMSSSVAAYIDMLSTFKVLPLNAKFTAEFVQLMDNLFDSMNGSDQMPPSKDKRFRCGLSEDSPHLNFWSKLLDQMSNHWKLKDLRSGQDCTEQYKFIKGWQTTLNSIQFLWDNLYYSDVNTDFMFLNLRSLNLDPLDNLFYSIREHVNGFPSCRQFSAALKNMVVNRFPMPTAGGNCENDDCTPLGDFFQLHVCKVNGKIRVSEADLNFDLKNEGLGANGMKNLLQKFKSPNCKTCRKNLYSSRVTLRHLLVTFKEWDDMRGLKYASEQLMEFLQNVHKNLYEFLDQDRHKCLLEDTFISIFLEHYVFKFCSQHNTNKMVLELVVPFLINRYVCNMIPIKEKVPLKKKVKS